MTQGKNRYIYKSSTISNTLKLWNKYEIQSYKNKKLITKNNQKIGNHYMSLCLCKVFLDILILNQFMIINSTFPRK